eukprot:scaffold143391_cov49-Cyclotella_meneghiniana.AAC.1
MSIMNGDTSLRLESIVYSGHHKLSFESWVERILACSPHISHQEWVCLDEWTPFIAAGLFQCLIMSIMNGDTRLRLESIVYSGHHKLTFESWVLRLESIVYSGQHTNRTRGKLAPCRNYRFLCAALSTPQKDTRTEWAAHQQICSNCSDTRKDANWQGAANLHN